MHMRTLGNTKLSMCELALGTWGLADGAYGAVDRATFEATVIAALDAGVKTFDMAPLWGDGLAEEVVGSVVGARRDEVFYVTRAGYARVDGALEARFDADGVRASCEASLARLGAARIDLLLLHDPPHWAFKPANAGWAKALAGLQAEGLIGAWGASVAAADDAREALSFGAAALCLPYNILHPYVLDELAEEIEDAGVGVIARSPLMYGLLADRFEPETRFGPGDHRRERWSPEALRIRVGHVSHLRFLVDGREGEMASAAVRFALHSPLVSSTAVGARRPEQIRRAATALGSTPYMNEAHAVRLIQVRAALGA